MANNKIIRAGMIGLGAMGLQMGKHMVAKGFGVTGFDIAPDAMERATEYGVTIVESPAEVAKNADVIVVMVQTDKQVEDVFHGMLESLNDDTVVCISSSIAPSTCRKLESFGAQKGIGVLDTPVVLGQEAANNGTMTVFVGGAETAFRKAEPVLRTFGANIIHLGESGSGQIAKTINNLLLWACMSANFEALTLAKELGADLPKLIAALAHSSGANWSLSRWGKSTGKWAEKDMDVALEMAQQAKVPMPLTALVDQLMKTINQEKMKALLT